MGRIFSLLLTSLVFLVGVRPLLAQQQGAWTTTGAMISPRESHVQINLSGGRALVAGGFDNSGNVLSSAEIYTPSTGTWTSTGAMANARDQFAAVALPSGKVLVAGGAGVGGAVVGAAELYDPATGAWTAAGTLSVPRFAHTATLLTNGKVLVAGGCTANPCSTFTASAEIYDPATNAWTPTGSLQSARIGHAAVRLANGAVLVIGGTNGAALASCELYDAATGAWSAAASTNVARYLNGTTRLGDGKVLVTGGASGRYPLGSAEIYDPKANVWTLTGSLHTPRYAHGATLLGDKTVVLAGGYGQSISCGKDCTGYVPTSQAEIFDESTGTFTATTSLARAIAYQSATPMPDGRALASGGEGTTATCCVVISDSEFYIPLSLTLSSTSLNFGLLQVGLESAPLAVTATNASSHPVVFTSITSKGDYAQTNDCPATLEPGQGCQISVTFSPTAPGTRSGAVVLADNSPGSPKQSISLDAEGEALALGFSASSANLGSVAVGSQSSEPVTLTNDGSAAVSVGAVSIAPKGAFTQSNNCPASLGVQQTCTIMIVFTPPDVFTYKATLSVPNSAGAAAMLPLKGAGLDGGGG